MELKDPELQAHLEFLAARYDELPQWIRDADLEQDKIDALFEEREAEMRRMMYL